MYFYAKLEGVEFYVIILDFKYFMFCVIGENHKNKNNYCLKRDY